MNFPPISSALIDALDRAFPDKAPEKYETEADLKWRGGQVDVVRYLRAKLKEQGDNILTTKASH